MNEINKTSRRIKRKRRSTPIKGTEDRPRVVLSESNLYLRVQAINDSSNHTLAFSSTNELKVGDSLETSKNKKNKEWAKILGNSFAKRLDEIGIKEIVFDRNSRKYHGKVKEFCEEMRKSGIKF